MTDRRVVGVGLAAAGAAVAGSYGAVGGSPRFILARFNTLVVGAVPGVVTASAVQELGHLAGTLGFLLAAVLGSTVLTVAVVLGMAVGERVDIAYAHTGATMLFVWDVAVLVTGEFRTALVPAGAAATVVTIAVGAGGDNTNREAAVLSDRRSVIRTTLAAVGIGSIGGFIGSTQKSGPTRTYDPPETVQAGLRTAIEQSLEVDGLEPLVSEEFYQVDINQIDPVVDANDWALSVTGAVDSSLELSYDDLRERPTEHRFITLRCVGDELNGREMDTALWSGISVDALLDEAGTPDECCVMLRAADGYYEEFPLAALQEGLLAWGMNGKILPRGHGYPLRALVPGHWGEVNVKWLTQIEVLEEPATGYWEQRGWHGTGPVNPVAKLHSVSRPDESRIRVAGHAYAGTRGVAHVEVSTDGGRNWTQARLSEPLPGPVGDTGTPDDVAADAWRQWAFEYDSPGTQHDVVVRTVDDEGTVQEAGRTKPYPRGATGRVQRTIDP